MLKEIYQAALGMMPQQTRLEVIANNLSNANTTGFKRSSVFERNLLDARANFYNVAGDLEQEDAPVGSYFDFSQGSFQKTDNPLDIAIDNQNGFFVLQDENGNEFLSKSGRFKLSTDGTIVAMDGKSLLGVDGKPINIRGTFINDTDSVSDSKELNLAISNNGEVSVDNVVVGSILIMSVDNPDSLECVSDASFIATDTTSAQALNLSDVSLQQGWMENSNVDIVKEMVAMIELQRLYELGSKVIHTNDGTLDKSMAIGKYY